MPTVHLTHADPRRPLPVVVTLSLAELVLLSDRIGSLDLPVELDRALEEEPERARLRDRLADGDRSTTRRAHGLLATARDLARTDPDALVPRLRRIGLLDDAGTPVGDVVAALRNLSSPEATLVLDLAVTREGREARLRSWFAVVGTGVVQLATATGLTYELAWYDVSALTDALTRAATLDDPEDPDDPDDPDQQGDAPSIADEVELPFELFTDGTEAARRGRADLLAELVRLAPGPVRVDGLEVGASTAAELVAALAAGARGRLRVLVAAPDGDGGRRTVGVLSWLRVADGWRTLTPARRDGVPTLVVRRADEQHLARHVAPLLAQVVGGGAR